MEVAAKAHCPAPAWRKILKSLFQYYSIVHPAGGAGFRRNFERQGGDIDPLAGQEGRNAIG
jgi:hypothetical protein